MIMEEEEIEEEQQQIKDKLKVEMVGQPKIKIHHTRKSSFPYKRGGPEVEVNFTTKVNNVPMTCKFTDISVEIKPKDEETTTSTDYPKNVQNSVTMATSNVCSKSTLASRYILPNASLLANPLTTLMTALPATVTTASASPFYYVIKMKSPNENVVVSVPQKGNGSGIETVAVQSAPGNYVYAVPVSGSALNAQNQLAVLPQALMTNHSILPVIPNYACNLVDSKEGIVKSTVAMTTESKVGPGQPCVITMSAQEVNQTINSNNVLNQTIGSTNVVPQTICSTNVLPQTIGSTNPVNLTVGSTNALHQSIGSTNAVNLAVGSTNAENFAVGSTNAVDSNQQKEDVKPYINSNNVDKAEDLSVKTDTFKTEDLDDSDMSLGAQLLLNLSNQTIHRPPAAETLTNIPQTQPVAITTEKPCLMGNSQFPYRNLIFQVSKPIKTEPADDWSEASGVSDVGSFVSVKQEQPEQDSSSQIPVSTIQSGVLTTEVKPVETRSLPHHACLVTTGGNLPRVSNQSLPQSVSQMIQEHALANQNLPQVSSQVPAKAASKKNVSSSPKLRGGNRHHHHSYSQTQYDDAAGDAEERDREKSPHFIDWEKAKQAIEEEKMKAALRMSPTQMKSKHLSMHSKKPIRPVDRQKMGPWLKNLLDNETCPGLVWVDRSHKVFQVSWRHRARMGWDMKLDGDVFERWARHTGIYCDGDPPEPRRWKTNFRAALHSMSDVEELPGIRKGRFAYRRYYFRDFEEFDNPATSCEPATKKARKEDKTKLSSPGSDGKDEVTSRVTCAGNSATVVTSASNTVATCTNNSSESKFDHVEYIRVPLPAKKTAVQEHPDQFQIKFYLQDGSAANLQKHHHPNLATLLSASHQVAAQSAAATSPHKTKVLKDNSDTSQASLTGTLVMDIPGPSLTDADNEKEESSDVESTSSVELTEDVMDISEDHQQSVPFTHNATVTSFNIPTQEILGHIHPAETTTSSVTASSVVFTPPLLPVSSIRTIPVTGQTPVRIIHTSVDPLPFSVIPTTLTSIQTSLGNIPSVVPSPSCVGPGPSVIPSQSCVGPGPSVIPSLSCVGPGPSVIPSQSCIGSGPSVIPSLSCVGPGPPVITSQSSVGPGPPVVTSQSCVGPGPPVVTCQSCVGPGPPVVTCQSCVGPGPQVVTSQSCVGPGPPVVTSQSRVEPGASVISSPSCDRAGPSVISSPSCDGAGPSSYGSIMSPVKKVGENKDQKSVRLLPSKRKCKKSEDQGSQEMKPFCTFCEKLVRNLSTHLDRKHRKETAVAEALSFLSYLRSKTSQTSEDVVENLEDVDALEDDEMSEDVDAVEDVETVDYVVETLNDVDEGSVE